MQSGPLSPFDGWPVQHRDEKEQLYAWFCPPNVLVVQYQAPRFTVGTARAVNEVFDRVVTGARKSVRRAGGLVAIHDLREVRSADLAAERSLDETWHKLQPGDVQEVWLVNDAMGTFARLLVQAVSLVARATTGRPLQLARTIEEPLSRHAVQAPKPGGSPLEPAEGR